MRFNPNHKANFLMRSRAQCFHGNNFREVLPEIQSSSLCGSGVCVCICICNSGGAEMEQCIDATLLHDSVTDSTPNRVHLKRFEDPPPGNCQSPMLRLFVSGLENAHTHVGGALCIHPSIHPFTKRPSMPWATPFEHNTNKDQMVYSEVMQTVAVC